MILINFGIQDGERDYREWSYYETFSKEDYDKGKVNDFIILNEVYGVEEDDYDDNKAYWDNNRLIWVERVQDIDEATLDILRRYV